ncbi:esterase-like activity of phytase family protein [Flavobacterium algicola]|uniref:esterase-like activity of phytase family protein n=1 Tax=Flavobacterium algicola TaxID=556529 RepID=UPI001EFC7A55|nr:esterase-like activity of phytase family protein [Flavobacterium algicola]MCG9791286.1 esterase-like activity of phytase family protein [Flavobacterium algicola]
MRKLFFLALSTLSILSCSGLKTSTDKNEAPTLKFVDAVEVPYNTEFKNTLVGGLSSIDYDADNELYYFICDDKSSFNDARFYTAKIPLQSNKIESVDFQNVVTLKNAKGESYSDYDKFPDTSSDPEELRYNSKTKTVAWSSEGARVVSKNTTILQDPTLQEATLNGIYSDTYTLPSNLKMKIEEKGPRNNGVLEGLTFDKEYKTLYTNIEEPLYEDGAKATTSAGGLIRFYQFDVKSKQNTAQYAYLLEPIATEPIPANGFAVNGISSILYYDQNRLLTVERSYSVGRQSCSIKVYLSDISKATNVKNMASLQNQDIKLATKKLVLDMDDLGIFIDNIEGITFGPKLSNGKQSILFVSDNNFSDKQKTQILLFEVE